MDTTNGATLQDRLSRSYAIATQLRDADTRSPTSHGTFAQLCMLTLGGGLAFWAATFAFSLLPIAAEFRNAFSISYGEGVERVFPVHTPRIAKIEVTHKGKVRRAKLHYLRERVGKRALLVKSEG